MGIWLGRACSWSFLREESKGFSSLVRTVAAPAALGSAAPSSAEVAHHCLAVQESLAT